MARCIYANSTRPIRETVSFASNEKLRKKGCNRLGYNIVVYWVIIIIFLEIQNQNTLEFKFSIESVICKCKNKKKCWKAAKFKIQISGWCHRFGGEQNLTICHINQIASGAKCTVQQSLSSGLDIPEAPVAINQSSAIKMLTSKLQSHKTEEPNKRPASDLATLGPTASSNLQPTPPTYSCNLLLQLLVLPPASWWAMQIANGWAAGVWRGMMMLYTDEKKTKRPIANCSKSKWIHRQMHINAHVFFHVYVIRTKAEPTSEFCTAEWGKIQSAWSVFNCVQFVLDTPRLPKPDTCHSEDSYMCNG